VSLELFRDRLNQSRLHPNDIKWMPGWFGQFAQNRPAIDGLIWFGTEDVLKFLQKLRDGGAHGNTTLCSFRYVLVNAREFGRYVTHQSFVPLVANDASIFSPLIARNPCDATRSRHLFPKSLLGLNQ
jgi:hypothetical protein